MAVKSGYKQTEVGVIPEEWGAVTLESVAKIIDPQPDHRTPPEASIGEPYIGISDFLDQNTVNWDSSRKIVSKAVDKQQASFRIRSGDIIFGKIGTIGLPKYAPIVPFRYALSANVLLVQPSIEPHFVMSWLRSRACEKAVLGGLHTTSQAAFGINKMRRLIIPVPPLPEQRSIATVLRDVNDLLGALERLIAKKRDLKQAAMQQLLTGQTRLSGFSENWLPTTLGEVATFLSGGTPSRSNDEYWIGEIPWISATSLRCSEIWRSDSNVTEAAVAAGSKIAPIGSTLLLVRGSALHKEILCGLVTKRVCFNQDVKALVPHSKLFPRFLTTLIRGRAEDFLKLVSSAGNTAGVLDTKLLKAFEFLLPGLPEQTAIATVLSDMDAELAALEQRLAKTRALKQGMMQELLTGRTRLV